MRCVVCGKEVPDGGPTYANAWEASLKLHPCCSPTCSSAFNPDVHWIPAMRPAELSEPAAAEVMERGKRRIRQGDAPNLVARDLLLAGLAPWMVRRALLGAAAAAVSSKRRTGGLNLFGLFTFFTFGRGHFVHDPSSGLTDPRAALDGAREVDAWEAHFGLPRSSE